MTEAAVPKQAEHFHTQLHFGAAIECRTVTITKRTPAAPANFFTQAYGFRDLRFALLVEKLFTEQYVDSNNEMKRGWHPYPTQEVSLNELKKVMSPKSSLPRSNSYGFAAGTQAY